MRVLLTSSMTKLRADKPLNPTVLTHNFQSLLVTQLFHPCCLCLI